MSGCAARRDGVRRCRGTRHSNDRPREGAPRWASSAPCRRQKPVRDSQAYAELVLSLKPVVYYRMERPGSENDRFVVLRFRSRRPSRRAASWQRIWRLALPARAFWRCTVAARLGNRGPRVRPRLSQGRPRQTDGGAWVMAMNRPGVAMIANNWGMPTGMARDNSIGLHGTTGTSTPTPASVTGATWKSGRGLVARCPCSSGST